MVFSLVTEFGGKVTIGRPESKKKIEATLFMSLSLTSLKDIYFYAEVKKMTFDEILDLFELSAPKALKDTGFPNGFTVGFTLNPSGMVLQVHPRLPEHFGLNFFAGPFGYAKNSN